MLDSAYAAEEVAVTVACRCVSSRSILSFEYVWCRCHRVCDILGCRRVAGSLADVVLELEMLRGGAADDRRYYSVASVLHLEESGRNCSCLRESLRQLLSWEERRVGWQNAKQGRVD